MSVKRVIYYTDEQNDDFAQTSIRKRRIGKKYPYLHRSGLWNSAAYLLYYVIAIPIVYFVARFYLGLRFKNRRILRPLRKTGFFLYGNHTQYLDAFVPALSVFPERAYIIANADAVSIPFLHNVVQMLGAIPIPTEASGLPGFLRSISVRIAQGSCIAVYPEAHIWPFYTGIRSFSATSFRYPVRENVPAVVMVTTYRKRRGVFRFINRPAMTVTFSEPFYPDSSLPPKQAQAKLRDSVYAFMKETASAPGNEVYIDYRPRGENDKEEH